MNELEKLYIEYLKDSYKLSIETRNFEINNFINRNNFFMLFQGVLLAAVMSNQASKPFVEFYICLLGVILSWYQINTGAGAKYWQTYWEKKADLTESQYQSYLTSKGLEPLPLFKFNDNNSHESINLELLDGNFIDRHIIRKKPSVTKIAIKASILIFIVWFLLLLHTLNLNFIFDGFKELHQIMINIISGHFFKLSS